MIILTQEQISELPVSIRESLASDERSAIDTLLYLGGDSEKSVIVSLLQNTIVPIQLLEQFSTSEDEDIRTIVAESTRTPVNILENLSNDSSLVVSEAAKNNINYVSIPVLEE